MDNEKEMQDFSLDDILSQLQTIPQEAGAPAEETAPPAETVNQARMQRSRSLRKRRRWF